MQVDVCLNERLIRLRFYFLFSQRPSSLIIVVWRVAICVVLIAGISVTHTSTDRMLRKLIFDIFATMRLFIWETICFIKQCIACTVQKHISKYYDRDFRQATLNHRKRVRPLRCTVLTQKRSTSPRVAV